MTALLHQRKYYRIIFILKVLDILEDKNNCQYTILIKIISDEILIP